MSYINEDSTRKCNQTKGVDMDHDEEEKQVNSSKGSRLCDLSSDSIDIIKQSPFISPSISYYNDDSTHLQLGSSN